MNDWIIEEWRQRQLGVLIVGGQAMLADGLREKTKDLDACLSASQCPPMLEWLIEKDRQGLGVDIRAGSAPLPPDWLGRGWTCHIEIGGTERLDFFGIPLRAPNRLVERFFEDPSEIAGALRSDEIRDTLKKFWRKHQAAIRGKPSFADRHAVLLAAARADLPVSPIEDPVALIEAARVESGAVRWPELLPSTQKLVAQYFPEHRAHLGTRFRNELKS